MDKRKPNYLAIDTITGYTFIGERTTGRKGMTSIKNYIVLKTDDLTTEQGHQNRGNYEFNAKYALSSANGDHDLRTKTPVSLLEKNIVAVHDLGTKRLR